MKVTKIERVGEPKILRGFAPYWLELYADDGTEVGIYEPEFEDGPGFLQLDCTLEEAKRVIRRIEDGTHDEIITYEV